MQKINPFKHARIGDIVVTYTCEWAAIIDIGPDSVLTEDEDGGVHEVFPDNLRALLIVPQKDGTA